MMALRKIRTQYDGRVRVTIFGNAIGESIVGAVRGSGNAAVASSAGGNSAGGFSGNSSSGSQASTSAPSSAATTSVDGVTQQVSLQVDTQSVVGSISVGDELPPGYTRTSEGRIIEEVVVTGRYTGNDPSVLAGNDPGALAYGRAFLNEVYDEVEDRAVARGSFLNYALARTGRNVGNFAFGLAETAVAVVNDPKSAVVGAFKAIPNFGPEVFNAGVNLAKTSANGLTLLAEETPLASKGTFEGFRASDPYNVTPLLSYNNQAEQGGSLVANLLIGFGLAKYGNYAFSPARAGAAASFQRVSFRPNADGIVRTEAQALEIAEVNGVEIPDNVVFRFVDDAAYQKDIVSRYGDSYASYGRVSTSDTNKLVRLIGDVADKDGIITVQVRGSVLASDEAIVGVLGHEAEEITQLTKVFKDNGGALRLQKYREQVAPGYSGSPHSRAVDYADQLVLKMRAQQAGGK